MWSRVRFEVITSKVLRSPPWLGWSLWNICVTNDHGYVPLVANTSWSFPNSWLVTGFVTRLTRRATLVEQELLTLPEHLSSPPVFSGVRVTRSLVVCVCVVDRCLSLCTFSFGYCVVCSSTYGFWLPLWCLQTLLSTNYCWSSHSSWTINVIIDKIEIIIPSNPNILVWTQWVMAKWRLVRDMVTTDYLSWNGFPWQQCK